jgi:hypothetical protein
VRQLKGLYFLLTKKAVFEAFLSASSGASRPPPPTSAFGMAQVGSVYQAPRITVNRIRASRAREEGTSASEQHSVFHQIWQVRASCIRTWPV